MASYHCTVKAGAKGSALKHADYISRSGEYKSYKSREDLEFSSSGNMPSWAKKNPAELWKAADEFERKNGTAYREIEIALPRELTREQRIELVEDFVQKELGDRHAYQYAIHNPPGAIDGKEQPHAHIMFCERINDGIERDPQQFFKRANSKSPERGGAKKASIPQTAGERKAALVALRSRWADVQNEHLARHGHESRVDHRSLKEQGINRTPEIHFGPVHATNLNEGQIAAIQEHRAAARQQERAARNSAPERQQERAARNPAPERQHERTERRPAPERQQELEQKQKTKIKAVSRSPELLAQYRKVMKTVIQGEARLARLGDANPNALKEQKLLQNAKAKKDSLSEWSRRIYAGARYLDKLERNVFYAQRELREVQEQRNALNGIRGLFRGADKREIDARILEQKSVLETAEHERNEFRDKLRQAESEWDKENAAFKRTEGYKYVGDLDRYREREILAAASLENTRQKVAEEVSLVRGQMLSLEQELKISGDEKSQLRHELQAEIAQERQQQEEKVLRIQRSWAREASRSNERDQDMER
ncbi:MobA/MobL family protein (plasmid) [Escherichia coli]|nr:MobA/MobL family protein [Escherichia coli]